MKATNPTIKSELKRRMDLVNSEDFRTSCAEIAKQVGITSEEWNNNKAVILMMWANEFCRIENETI